MVDPNTLFRDMGPSLNAKDVRIHNCIERYIILTTCWEKETGIAAASESAKRL